MVDTYESLNERFPILDVVIKHLNCADTEKKLLKGFWPRLCGNLYFRYPCLKNFFHNCPITNDLKFAKA